MYKHLTAASHVVFISYSSDRPTSLCKDWSNHHIPWNLNHGLYIFYIVISILMFYPGAVCARTKVCPLPLVSSFHLPGLWSSLLLIFNQSDFGHDIYICQWLYPVAAYCHCSVKCSSNYQLVLGHNSTHY